MHQSAAYYAELTQACDAVLHAQPVEPNSLYEVFVDKSQLPSIIADLNPHRLWLSSNSVSLDFGEDNWIGWGPDETRTNVWTLGAHMLGPRRTVYEERR